MQRSWVLLYGAPLSFFNRTPPGRVLNRHALAVFIRVSSLGSLTFWQSSSQKSSVHQAKGVADHILTWRVSHGGGSKWTACYNAGMQVLVRHGHH